MTDDLPTPIDADEYDDIEPDPTASDRYARLTLQDESVIVYDRRCTNAWIQSDVSYPLPPRTPSTTADEDANRSGTAAESRSD